MAIKRGFSSFIKLLATLEMNQSFLLQVTNANALDSDRYNSLTGNYYDNGSATNNQLPMSAPGTLSKLYILLDQPPGLLENVTIVVRKNGSDTGLLVDATGAIDILYSDITNLVSFVAGDILDFRYHCSTGNAALSIGSCILCTLS